MFSAVVYKIQASPFHQCQKINEAGSLKVKVPLYHCLLSPKKDRFNGAWLHELKWLLKSVGHIYGRL